MTTQPSKTAGNPLRSNASNGTRKFSLDDETPPTVVVDSPGRLLPDVYEATLPKWRAAIRRPIAKSVEWESRVIAKMQDKVRTPWLDAYFVYTSSLGTHTFFMTVLPVFFFFGYDERGRELLVVLALGVYCSSFIKDLICSPRPLAPPVSRLTIGTHHLEYGFPSTHSTNSVSIALFIYSSLSSTSAFYTPACIALAWYTFSIVYGRLYTAMHSFTDCVVGVLMGAGIWAAWWTAGPLFDAWVAQTGWAVPLLIIPLGLIMVNQHPQPVDDCPCFEDAIAFISVVMGSTLAHWHTTHYGTSWESLAVIMPGSSWETWTDVGIWVMFATAKMVVGVMTIFIWRILAKSTLHMVLPPTFRFLAQAFTLPNRRFYTPATDYKSVPSELGLRPIPSVIDLPSHLEMETDEGRGSGFVAPGSGLKMRSIYGNFSNNGNGALREKGRTGTNKSVEWELEKDGSSLKDENIVKHYDADVLTKVIVYCGIAVIVCELMPALFNALGWGVRST